MTHRPIRTEADGTRVYVGGHRYKPMDDSVRTYRVRKPADPRAVRFRGDWFLPLPVIPITSNRPPMPETRPDDDAYAHMSTNLFCRCSVCLRPEAERYRRRWRRHQGLQP